MLLDLSKFLVTRGRQKMTTVLIVDEAHDLPVDTLEELRLLSNLETTDDKLLQIILVGQPELDKKLDSFELRQLKQRVALRTSLGALTVQQTQEYIEQRLVNAGADPANGTPFSPQAVEAIYSYSHGLPRIINILCENALLSAYAKETQTVTPRIIEDVASEFRLESYWQPEQPVQVEQG
jgi:general secretion pathway protein A